jgi:hypothetical protein
MQRLHLTVKVFRYLGHSKHSLIIAVPWAVVAHVHTRRTLSALPASVATRHFVNDLRNNTAIKVLTTMIYPLIQASICPADQFIHIKLSILIYSLSLGFTYYLYHDVHRKSSSSDLHVYGPTIVSRSIRNLNSQIGFYLVPLSTPRISTCTCSKPCPAMTVTCRTSSVALAGQASRRLM